MALIQESEHKAAFHLYLLSAAWDTSLGPPELDRDDGEVRVLVEVALADALMTESQLRMCIHGSVELSRKIRAEGLTVLKTEQLPASTPSQDVATMARLAIVQLMETAQGRAAARVMTINSELPAVVHDVAQKMIPFMHAIGQAEAAPTSI